MLVWVDYIFNIDVYCYNIFCRFTSSKKWLATTGVEQTCSNTGCGMVVWWSQGIPSTVIWRTATGSEVNIRRRYSRKLLLIQVKGMLSWSFLVCELRYLQNQCKLEIERLLECGNKLKIKRKLFLCDGHLFKTQCFCHLYLNISWLNYSPHPPTILPHTHSHTPQNFLGSLLVLICSWLPLILNYKAFYWS